jgi:phosphatidylglycerophosphate synthase
MTPNLAPASEPVHYQPKIEGVSVYFGRLLSRHVTPLFLATPLSANDVTAVWGAMSVANGYLLYLTLCGRPLLTAAVFAVFYLALVVDCSDGEVARARKTANPIGGKLLDGVWHKATEFSLLAAYAGAAADSGWGKWAFPLGLFLMAGEAMYTYAYERRLLVIRVHAKSTESISGTTDDDKYVTGQLWRDFPTRKKVMAVYGLLQYKSVYFMVALSLVSPDALFAGVVVLAVYKHFDWIRIINQTVQRSKHAEQG